MLLVFLLLAIANLDILQNKRLENAQQVGRTLARSYAVEEGRSVSILAVTANAFAEDIAAHCFWHPLPEPGGTDAPKGP